jgi:hypothetical protein
VKHRDAVRREYDSADLDGADDPCLGSSAHRAMVLIVRSFKESLNKSPLSALLLKSG